MRGVIGRKAIHLIEADERKQAPELKGLHIDIGAAATATRRASGCGSAISV